MEVGTMPEQQEDGGVVEYRRRGKHAELPLIVHKGEISSCKGDDTSSDFHVGVGVGSSSVTKQAGNNR